MGCQLADVRHRPGGRHLLQWRLHLGYRLHAGYGSPEALQAIQAIADLTNVDQIAPVPAALRADGHERLAGAGQRQRSHHHHRFLGASGYRQARTSTTVVPCLPVFQEPATVMLAHSHCISSTTEHPDEAWKLLAYLSSDEYQLGLIKVGSLASEPHLAADAGRNRILDDGRRAPRRLRTDRHRLRGQLRSQPLLSRRIRRGQRL